MLTRSAVLNCVTIVSLYLTLPANLELCIEFDSKYQAADVFADIPHLIDNSVIPDWVRESNDGATCRPEYFNMDYSYDELPF